MSALKAELLPHPATPCDFIRRFSVAVKSSDHPRELEIRYRIDGDLRRLRLAQPGFARRSDGLWQHTCFEAFLRNVAETVYYEFNFAPSGDWAAYRFGDRRRDGTSPDVPYPPFALERSAEYCELTAFIPLAAMPELTRAAALRIGLAAVVEDEDATLSYWALAHAAAAPDFHDPETFGLQVARS
jgi:hypothetical protein